MAEEILFKRVLNNYPWYDIFLDLGESLSRFKDVQSCDPRDFPYIREATIQIFKYTFELFWNLLKKYALPRASKPIRHGVPSSTLTPSSSSMTKRLGWK